MVSLNVMLYNPVMCNCLLVSRNLDLSSQTAVLPSQFAPGITFYSIKRKQQNSKLCITCEKGLQCTNLIRGAEQINCKIVCFSISNPP